MYTQVIINVWQTKYIWQCPLNLSLPLYKRYGWKKNPKFGTYFARTAPVGDPTGPFSGVSRQPSPHPQGVSPADHFFFSKVTDTPVDTFSVKTCVFACSRRELRTKTNWTIVPTWPPEVPKPPRKVGCGWVGTSWVQEGARHWFFFPNYGHPRINRTLPYIYIYIYIYK